MSIRSLYTSRSTTEFNSIHQSFTDLMSNAFMILSLLLLLALFQSQKLNQDLAEANDRLRSASPIILDEQSGEFRFKSGSAELNQDFKNHLSNETKREITEILASKEIEFIQIIGHTDGQETNTNRFESNLDKTLETAAQGKQPTADLTPGSNADLGLMRALAVVQELQNLGLKNAKFRAYSAAQLYLSSGEPAPVDRQPDESRRRIEIRFIPPGQLKDE